METQPEHVTEHVMKAYQELVTEIDQDVKRVREEYGRVPCPTDCFQCCLNTSTIPIGEVEARDLKIALDALPQQVREHILQKAQRTIKILEAQGWTPENMAKDSGMEAIEVVKGKPFGACPMLIGGVCSVYEHRPVICRVWGYPIDNGKELACCKKTFIGQHKNYEPVKYADYWQRCKKLSEALGAVQKTPNCYLVAQLLEA